MSLAAVENAHADVSLRILKPLLHGFVGGANLRLWNDSSHSVGQGSPSFTPVLRDPMLPRSLVTTRGPVVKERIVWNFERMNCNFSIEGESQRRRGLAARMKRST